MRAKRFPHLAILVILIAVSACDNVSFEGIQMELRPPVAPPGAVEGDTATEIVEETPLEPVELGPLVYLVERTEGPAASILPVAELSEDGYVALPDTADIPDMIDRFAIGRWEENVEFSLLGHGGRVGTFVASGSTALDESTCRVRPRGSGIVEVSPGVAEQRWFLAVPQDAEPTDPDSPSRLHAVAPLRSTATAVVQNAALNVAQRLIPALGIPWPPSIPGARQDLQAFGFPTQDGVANALAAMHVFGGQLGMGSGSPNGYGFFFLAVESESRFDPVVSWYQREQWGKAFPRFLGLHSLRDAQGPDAVLEVFGETDRWLTILGPEDGEWGVLYQDACGVEPARGAVQSYP